MPHLKIWIDIVAPKEVPFCEPLIQMLKKKRHRVLCTSRRFDEITGLARMRGMKLVLAGRYGGASLQSKLEANIERQKKLVPIITRFGPDVAVSHCSVDASRIAYGLGIRHVAFSNAPWISAVMRLTMPLVSTLLIPRMIPKSAYTRYGVDPRNIIQYNAMDAIVTMRRRIDRSAPLPFKKPARNIVMRVEEEQSSYRQRSKFTRPIIRQLVKDHGGHNIVVLARYREQIADLRRLFGRHAVVTGMAYDGMHILENTDVFIGSGGTMTEEAALTGVPTISYNDVPNAVIEYLVKKRVATRMTDPRKISGMVGRMLRRDPDKRRAERLASSMEDPIVKIARAIESG